MQFLGSNSQTRIGTQALAVKSTESQPVDHWEFRTVTDLLMKTRRPEHPLLRELKKCIHKSILIFMITSLLMM